MYSKYKIFIDQFVSFNSVEWTFFRSKLSVKHYPKGTIIHYAGEVCDRLFFVNSGLIRAYIIDHNGKDHTWNICFNSKNAKMLNLFLVDYNSFITQKESQMSFEVLEDCELVSLEYKDMQILYSQSKKSERFGRLMSELAYTYSHNLVIDRLTKNAKQRYENFMHKTPFLMEKVPQYHIASLLGITPQHLSRLKNS